MRDKIRWASRVPMDWLRRLYEQDAAGIVDDELIEKVGYRLYERCCDCIVVSNTAEGRITCPMCRSSAESTGEGDRPGPDVPIVRVVVRLPDVQQVLAAHGAHVAWRPRVPRGVRA